jgi:hypothetical protein
LLAKNKAREVQKTQHFGTFYTVKGTKMQSYAKCLHAWRKPNCCRTDGVFAAMKKVLLSICASLFFLQKKTLPSAKQEKNKKLN